MKKIFLAFLFSAFATSALADSHTNSEAQKISFGFEGGYATAETKDSARTLAQSLANSTGRTVTYTYEEATYAGRIFGLYKISDNLDLELGYMNTSSMDANYSFSGTSVTASVGLKANGFDYGIRYNTSPELYFKLGMHSYDLDSTASVTISGTRYSATATSSETNPYYGIGYNFNETWSVGYTMYTKVGGTNGGDVGFLYAGYRF